MNIAIILSGGKGNRMGSDIPKQYLIVDDSPIILYSIKTFLSTQIIDYLIIGLSPEWQSFVNEYLSKLDIKVPIVFSEPGITRQYTIYNALLKIKEIGGSNEDIVIIHDAARPLVKKDLIIQCINDCKNAEGVLPVIPVKDTIYFSRNGEDINSLLDRNTLWSGQAPEAFNYGLYLLAHERMSDEDLVKINGSTEIAFKSGLKCRMIKGDPMNFKITTKEDFLNFKNIIENKK